MVVVVNHACSKTTRNNIISYSIQLSLKIYVRMPWGMIKTKKRRKSGKAIPSVPALPDGTEVSSLSVSTRNRKTKSSLETQNDIGSTRKSIGGGILAPPIQIGGPPGEVPGHSGSRVGVHGQQLPYVILPGCFRGCSREPFGRELGTIWLPWRSFFQSKYGD